MSAPLPPDRWARVEELFDRAMERPPSERRAFVASACGDDVALLAEVESLLAASDDGITRRVSAVDRVASDLMTSTGSTVAGMRLGPWRLDEEVGRGGMGVVYRATRDDGEFEQTAAVKVLPGALFSPGTAARFRNERRILAGLEHPNIARLLDGGTTREGVPWVVMEYVDGVPVDRYVEREGLSLENRVWLFLAVCDAVRYAHRNLVVHRDLKPSNILVTEDGTPKLLDFGIATLLDPEAQDEATGTRIMTPRFASPEQLLGLRIGTPSDVYSLGLVLYRILAGTDARSAETGASLSDAELLRQTLDRDPTPPSSAAGDARLKGDLDTIVLKALRRDPEDRYESAGALADDLERYLAGLPIQARRPTVGYRFRKFVGRNRGVVAAASVALVLAGAQTLLFMTRLADERDRAREEAERATRTLDFLTDLFDGANPWESGRSDLTARELLGRGVSRLEVGLEDQPEIQAGILSAVGRAYDALGVADSADVLLSRSVAIQRARLSPDDPDIARTLSQMAYQEHMGGEFATADTLLLEAMEILDASPDGGDRELRASLLRSRAGALIELRRLEEADSALHASLEIREADLGRRHPAVASTLDQIARLRELQGRFRESEALYRETIDWGEELLGEDHSQVTTWYNNLASVVRGLERNEEALEIQERVVERRRREFPEGHILLAGALNNVGNMYGNLGRFEEADAAFEEGRAVLEAIHGADHPLGATMLNNQSTLAWRQGDHDRAVELSTRVLELDREQLGPRHEYIATDLTNIGINLVLAGRAQEAEEPLRQALELARDLRGPEHPTTINAELAWVDWLVAVGRGAEGVELARKALEYRREIMDEETALVGYGRSTLGAALAQAGEMEEARDELLRARAILAAAAPQGDPMARRNERRIQALGVARAGGVGAESGDRATGAGRL